MTKVYPSLMTSSARAAEKLKRFSSSTAGVSPPPPPPEPSTSVSENAVALTVWTKSLLFNCTGFTVFDSAGNLVYRVDNYIAGNKGEIVLMDASGKSLFTIRRKRLSLGDNWMIFDGDTAAKPRFTVKKHVNIVNTRCLAHVSSGGGSGGSPRSAEYEIEGSYTRRCCAVYDQKRRRVAEIRRKEAAVGGVAFGGDVFRLLVEPQIDTALAMSLVILLDQMYGSSSSRR